ncbi:MAG TPA: phage tail protein, partial [Roseiflexaceae bacterium]
DLDSAPILRQMRLEYDQETWLRHLPAIYARDEAGRGFLERALSLFAGTLADAAALIDDLPRLFDPSAAADQPPSLWLDWLAGWLAFELDSNWTDVRRRQAVADAFAMHGRRGTVEGLRHFIELYTGVQAHITESAAAISLWVLGEQTALGFDTMLAPVHPQGAVLGATATLDQAHLLAEGQDWVPLFAEIAHHFCVRLYAADIADPRVVERVRQVVEQEKPAHTTYHLCLIEPRMQVGLQAQLGVDSIVGGPPHDLVAGEPRRLGFDTMLPGANHRDGAGATFGEDAWVGIGTRLG